MNEVNAFSDLKGFSMIRKVWSGFPTQNSRVVRLLIFTFYFLLNFLLVFICVNLWLNFYSY